MTVQPLGDFRDLFLFNNGLKSLLQLTDEAFI